MPIDRFTTGFSNPLTTINNFLQDIADSDVFLIGDAGFTIDALSGPISVLVSDFIHTNTLPVSGTIDLVVIGGAHEGALWDLIDQGLDYQTLFDALITEINGSNPAAIEELIGSLNWQYQGDDNADIFLDGTLSSDGTLIEMNGDDVAWLAGGDDIFAAQRGQDNLHGQDGNDTLYGGQNRDVLHGQNGNDTLYGGSGVDVLRGGSGSDFLFGDSGADTLYGGGGSDTMTGGTHNDELFGGNGRDTLFGGNGDDIINGGSGDDTLTGGNGGDVFIFGNSDGENRITDFDPEVDTLYFRQGYNEMAIAIYSDGVTGDLIYAFEDTMIFLEGLGTGITEPISDADPLF